MDLVPSFKRVKRIKPEDFLVIAAATGSPSMAVSFQEKHGQRSLVDSEVLPTDMRGEARAVLEAAGVRFLGVVEDDPMFQYVTLPKGWKRVPTDHLMWTDLVDDKGRKRAAIFYKAAFYDRSAHIDVNRRYGISIDYKRCEEEKVAVAMVNDADGTVIYTTNPVGFEGEKSDYDAQDKARALAVAWLKEHYPNWKDPSAYWS